MTQREENSSLRNRMPVQWTHKSSVKTRTELLAWRRTERIPDGSFDLDGDGVVSGRDYLISKRFDKDQDGKLNANEKASALKALNEGYADSMVWGCEASGVNRSFRIIQKRGIPIVDECFAQIQTTYPKFDSGVPRVENKTRLAEKRKDSFKGGREFKLNLSLGELIDLESYNWNPQYKTFTEKRETEKLKRRNAGGLQAPSGISQPTGPSLAYVQNPRYRSQLEMNAGRKHQLMRDLGRTVNYSHRPCLDAICEREAMISPETTGKTYLELRNKQLAKDTAHNMNVFAVRPLGVHGTNLPQFHEHRKEYWKVTQGQTGEQSLRKLIQTRKK